MTREQFAFHVSTGQKALRRFLTALCCGDSMLADDIAQETYLKAYMSLDSLVDTSRFRSWTFSIAYRTFLDNRRASRASADLSTAETLASEQTDPHRYQALYAALDALNQRERYALLLFYMQGYSIKEIAEITSSTPDAVKQLLLRGRQHLKKILPDDERY